MNVAQAACDNDAACLLRCRVLLVEDDDSNAGWEQDALELFGCHVVRARDGVMAVNLGTSSQFDLILMDCHMPLMDGMAATQAIRDFEAATQREHTPIVAVTASVMPCERQRCIEIGMDGVLPKPFMLGDLGDVLDRWIIHRKNRCADRKITCLRQPVASYRICS